MATTSPSKRHLGLTSSTLISTSDVTVGGNLIVNGTTTTLNTATLQVEDKNIELNKGGSATSSNLGGITVLRGTSASAQFIWDQGNTRWDISNGLHVDGEIFTKSHGKSSQWATAYGWGNHADGGYAASGHNHDDDYLGKTAKAADSQKLDGLDSTKFLRDNGWNSHPGQDADLQIDQSVDFTYANNAPHSGPLIRIGADSYSLQLNATYNDDAGKLSFRSWNQDSAKKWNPWRTIFHSGVFTNNSANWNTAYGWGNHADAGYKTTDNNTLYNFAGTLFTSRNSTNVIKIDDAHSNMVGYTNTSTDAGYADGGLFVAAYSSSWVSQIFSNFRTGEISVRGKNSGTWQDWRFVHDSGHFSTTDVANGVTAHGWGNHADAGYKTTDNNTQLTSAEIAEMGYLSTSTGLQVFRSEKNVDDQGTYMFAQDDGGWTGGARMAGAHNGYGVLSMHLHSGNYYGQIHLSSQTGDMGVRFQENSTTWSSIHTVHTTKYFSTADVAKGVTAHGWGNHADAGYKTTDNDTIFSGGNVKYPVVIDNTSANCVLHWSDSGDSTGAIKIKLPGFHSKSNWSMLVLRVTLYEYTSDAHTIYTVSGHDWTSGWYNKRIKKHGQSAKDLHYAYSTSADEDYLILGEVTDGWKYGHVTVDVIAHPGFYHSAMNISTGWEISQRTDLEGVTIQKSVNERVIDESYPSVSNWNTAHGWGNHASEGYLTAEADTLDTVADRGASTNQTIKSTNGLGFRVDSSGSARIEIENGGSNWAYLRLRDDSTVSWDIASYNGGDLEWRPGGSETKRMTYSSGGVLTVGDGFTSTKGNTAYGWGDHGDAGYAASSHNNNDDYLGKTAKAADSEKVDGVDSSRIVYGANSRRSTRADGEGIVSPNQNSGFHYGYDPDGAPFTEWWNWLTVAGASWTSGNNYDFKLAHNFHGDDFYVSRMTNGVQASWRKIVDESSASYNNGNWDTAHGWGNHADEGYLKTLPGHNHAGTHPLIDTATERGPDFDKLMPEANHTTYKEVHAINEGLNIPSGYTYGVVKSQYMGSMKYQEYVPHTASRGSSPTQDTIWFRTNWGGNSWYAWRYHIHSGNIGSQSVDNASKLDGIDSGSFLRSDANDSASGSYSFTNSYNEFGNSTSSVTNDGGWNARVNLAGSSHARLDVKSVSDGIITTMYAHVGHGAGKIGTMSSHPIQFMTGGTTRGQVNAKGVLHMAGDIVGYWSFSDRRLKTNVKPLENNLEKVLALHPVSYQWKEGERKGSTDIGLIAQEVEEIVPEVVREQERLEGDSTKTYKTVDYEHLVSVLIGAVKEQQEQINELKSKMCKCNGK